MAPKKNPFSSHLGIPCGSRPVKDVEKKGVRQLRPHQSEGVKALVGPRFSIYIAPTGSGKSVALKALAYLRARDKREKVIVAVPETSISESFDNAKEAYALPDGSIMKWQVEEDYFLFGGQVESTVDAICEFVRKRKSASLAKSILVCTHQALVLADARLRAGKSKVSPWKGVTLAIDEAHRICAADSDDLVDGRASEDRSNKLGALVEHYIAKEPGSLILTTATWMRGDQDTIVPNRHLGKFAKYEYPLDEYLASLLYLKRIKLSFSFDKYTTALKKTLAQDPKQNLLVFMPPVQKGQVEAKHKLLSSLLRACGASTPGTFTSNYDSANPRTLEVRRHKSGATSLDLVTEEGRGGKNGRLSVWNKVKQECGVNVIFTQNLFRMGTDWPAAQRALVLAPRKSLPMTIQMLGRLLRDYKGKKEVEFHIVIQDPVVADIEDFWLYSNSIFMVMALGWHFSEYAASRGIRTSETIRALQKKVAETVLSGGAENRTFAETVGQCLEDAVRETSDDPETAVKALTPEDYKMARDLIRKVTGVYAYWLVEQGKVKAQELEKDIKSNAFVALQKCYTATLGLQKMKEFRESVLNAPEVTVEYMDQQLFLHRCIYFALKGQFVDPRTIKGATKLFGNSAKKLDEACTREGLTRKGYVGDARL